MAAQQPPPRRPVTDRREDGTLRIRPGVYLLGQEASPQFHRPILVRVIRELTERQPPYGWTWVNCYQLDTHGDAAEKRQLFVMPEGMRPVHVPPVPYAARRRPARAAR
ncbi:hypothetical protein [Micromonospora sp. WMMD1082]|uniref:hypothetical protein n=1 Tax=Micromonospora sp. WMMD1082 TaxID=3016104 RepID=UPI002417A950|nr:hypothetical protein [Micromonospora sp. WMMD1082]MDG4794677.1 hypothetical protein [Micromonospora sp. WMMD1082]